MRSGGFIACLFGLAGCLEPVELPLLADVEMSENAPESGLIAPDVEAPETVLEELESVENLPDIASGESAEQAADAAEPEKPRRGLAALFGPRNKPVDEKEDETAVADVAAGDGPDPDTGNEPVEVAPDEATAEDAAKTEDAEAAVVEAPRKGLFARLGNKRRQEARAASEQADETAKAEDAATPVADTPDENVVIAAIDPADTAQPERPKRGLFGARRPKADQYPQVERGVVLPYGEIGLACGVRGRALGKEVDRFKSYRLYDSDPSITLPRTHYVTGFKDNCPRQFTAALALLGSPVLHEQLLLIEERRSEHMNAADKVFEKLRARICRVGPGKPCPEKRIGALEKAMVFVTTYERFGGNATWDEILLHNGTVAVNSAKVQ